MTHCVSVRIRSAVMPDSPAVREIRNRAIRESLAIWTSREQTADEAAAWLEPQVARGTALVAVEGVGSDARVLGFAVAMPWRRYEGYARTVEDSVYLSPTAPRGQGIGGRLLDALITACQHAGDRTMVAAVESGNTASARLHQRHGFTVVGTIPQAGEKLGQVLDLTLMSRLLLPGVASAATESP